MTSEELIEYEAWFKEMLRLHDKAMTMKVLSVRRGEVYRCQFGKGIGHEQQNTRPAVILQYDVANARSQNTIVAPITHRQAFLPNIVKLTTQAQKDGKHILDGYVLLGNIVTISKARLLDKITVLPKEDMQKIDHALMCSVGVNNYVATWMRKYNNAVNHLSNLEKKYRMLQSKLQEMQSSSK